MGGLARCPRSVLCGPSLRAWLVDEWSSVGGGVACRTHYPCAEVPWPGVRSLTAVSPCWPFLPGVPDAGFPVPCARASSHSGTFQTHQEGKETPEQLLHHRVFKKIPSPEMKWGFQTHMAIKQSQPPI